MSLGLALKLANATLFKGVGVPGPYPAPSGFRWTYVVESSVPVTEAGVRIVELQRIAA